jgi:hypothetical protein
MKMEALFSTARKKFPRETFEKVLTVNNSGVVSNADKDSRVSKEIALRIAALLKAEVGAERLAGQTSGSEFESICAKFLQETFLFLGHLRPGLWDIHQVGGRSRLEIANYEQYSHLVALDNASKKDPELAAALGSDYTITPDIVVLRNPEDDVGINRMVALLIVK